MAPWSTAAESHALSWRLEAQAQAGTRQVACASRLGHGAGSQWGESVTGVAACLSASWALTPDAGTCIWSPSQNVPIAVTWAPPLRGVVPRAGSKGLKQALLGCSSRFPLATSPVVQGAAWQGSQLQAAIASLTSMREDELLGCSDPECAAVVFAAVPSQVLQLQVPAVLPQEHHLQPLSLHLNNMPEKDLQRLAAWAPQLQRLELKLQLCSLADMQLRRLVRWRCSCGDHILTTALAVLRV